VQHTYLKEATIGEHGKLVLEDLPFEPGQPVDVLVISRSAPHTNEPSLRNSVLEYHEPFEPVALEDWNALR
jgi:hypothetical protein